MIIFSGPRGQGQGHTEVKDQIYIYCNISVYIEDGAKIPDMGCRLGHGLAMILFSRPTGQGQGHTEVKSQIYVKRNISLYI